MPKPHELNSKVNKSNKIEIVVNAKVTYISIRWEKCLQSLKLISIYFCEELRAQDTHHLSSNVCRKRGITPQGVIDRTT